MKGGPPGNFNGGSGGGGIGFENFNSPGGNPVDTLPTIPAMVGGNPGYAYPPPSSVSKCVLFVIVLFCINYFISH